MVLTLDQLDKHPVLKVMGKTAQRLPEDNRSALRPTTLADLRPLCRAARIGSSDARVDGTLRSAVPVKDDM